MMNKLLMKEWRLALHPANLAFFALSAMLLIPNYPYYVTFFYTSLGIFFVCLTARENHDMEYSMLLPIRKRDLVKSRIAFCVTLEAIQVLLAVPFAFLRQSLLSAGNMVGMDANIAFFGLSFLMMGLFNLVFFTLYYHNPDKVGKAFVVASVAEFVFMIIAEVLTHVVPLFRDQLDTPDPQFLALKLMTLLIGFAGFALMTLIAYLRSANRFEALDLR